MAERQRRAPGPPASFPLAQTGIFLRLLAPFGPFGLARLKYFRSPKLEAGELASRVIEVSKPKLAKLSFAAVTSLSGSDPLPSVPPAAALAAAAVYANADSLREHSIDGNTAALLILKTEK